ncbi:unnamed protein product [Caretta caretta]
MASVTIHQLILFTYFSGPLWGGGELPVPQILHSRSEPQKVVISKVRAKVSNFATSIAEDNENRPPCPKPELC